MKKKETKEQQIWQKKYSEGKASFSWTIDDYKIWKIDAPECLKKNNNDLTEGQQISDTELEGWFIDSVKTLAILKENDLDVFNKVYQDFILDVKYLISINRMKKENLNYILDKNNFNF